MCFCGGGGEEGREEGSCESGPGGGHVGARPRGRPTQFPTGDSVSLCSGCGSGGCSTCSSSAAASSLAMAQPAPPPSPLPQDHQVLLLLLSARSARCAQVQEVLPLRPSGSLESRAAAGRREGATEEERKKPRLQARLQARPHLAASSSALCQAHSDASRTLYTVTHGAGSRGSRNPCSRSASCCCCSCLDCRGVGVRRGCSLCTRAEGPLVYRWTGGGLRAGGFWSVHPQLQSEAGGATEAAAAATGSESSKCVQNAHGGCCGFLQAGMKAPSNRVFREELLNVV